MATNFNERIFSLSVFKGLNQRELSDQESKFENELNENKNILKPPSGGIQDDNSMIEPNDGFNFDTKSYVSKKTHATHMNIA